MILPRFNRPAAFAIVLLTLVGWDPCMRAESATGAVPETARNLWARDRLAAWLVQPPWDAVARGPEQRAQMLEKLGIRNFVYMVRDRDTSIIDAEIEALNRHNIKLTACRINFELNDPVVVSILQTFERHHVQPQLWVIQSNKNVPWPKPWDTMATEDRDKELARLTPELRAALFMRMNRSTFTKTPDEQALRVKQEADRIDAFVKLAARYGCSVAIANHSGWFGLMDNQVAVIERLKELGTTGVGIVYNFSHARDELHDDTVDFTAIWKKIQPHVVAINITGMGWEKQFVYPSQGDSELDMMRTIQESGWSGQVAVIGEKGGDAEATLTNYLIGIDWLAAELRQPGSGGPRPFLMANYPKSTKTMVEAKIARKADNKVIESSWGRLTWYISRELKNSDTMTVGQAVIKPGQSNPRHFHPNCDEVLHVLKGRIVQSAGDKSFEMGEGDTVSIPAGTRHSAKNIGTVDAVLAISFSSADRQTIGEDAPP